MYTRYAVLLVPNKYRNKVYLLLERIVTSEHVTTPTVTIVCAASRFHFPHETLTIASPGVTPKEDAPSSQEEGAGGRSLNQVSSMTLVSVLMDRVGIFKPQV